MTVQVLVPFRWTPDRGAAFVTVMDHLEAGPWPVTIAGDDHDPFRRAHALNMAVRNSEADIVVVNDADSVCPDEQMREAVRLASEQPGLVFAYTTYVRLDKSGGVELVLREPSSHGCVAIQRGCFLHVGGYNEDYVGWGPEDQDFNLRAEQQWPSRRVKGELTHLWHGPRRDDDSPLDTPAEAVNANWKLWEQTSA